jgi:hypothetical protein
MASVGCAYTVVQRARTKEEYLRGLRYGFGKVRGETGGFWKLTRDVFAIGGEMVRENPWTLPIAALGGAVPLILLGNYVAESLFARLWMARYLQARRLRGPLAEEPVVEAAA